MDSENKKNNMRITRMNKDYEKVEIFFFLANECFSMCQLVLRYSVILVQILCVHSE